MPRQLLRNVRHMGSAVAVLIASSGLSQALAEQTAAGAFAAYSKNTDITAIFKPDGTGNPAVGESLTGCTILDSSQFGGKTAAQWIAGLDNLKSSGVITSVGSPASSGTYDTATGVGTAYRDDGSNSSGVHIPAVIGDLYLIDFENTGSVTAQIREDSTGGSIFLNIPAGDRVLIPLKTTSGAGFYFSLGSNGSTASFTLHSFKHLPGNHTVLAGTGPTLLDEFDQTAPALTDNGGRGPELVTNGTFDSGVSGWTEVLATLASVSGELELTAASGGAGRRAIQSFTVEVGAEYEITGIQRAGTVSTFVRAGTTSGGSEYVSSTDATVSEKFRAVSATVYVSLVLDSASTDDTGYFDSISVRRVQTALDERGGELVANGTFDSDLSGWAEVGSSGFITQSEGKAVWAAGGAYLSQQSPEDINAGDVLELEVDIEVTSGTLRIGIGSTGEVVTVSSSGAYKFELRADGDFATYGIWFHGSGGSFSGSVDNVSAKKVLYPNLNPSADGQTYSYTGSGQNNDLTDHAFTEGRWYKVSGFIENHTTGELQFGVGDFAAQSLTSPVNSDGYFEGFLRATGSSSLMRLRSSGSGATFDVTNFKSQEVPASIARLYCVATNGTDDALTMDIPSGHTLTDMMVSIAFKTSDTTGLLVSSDSQSRWLGAIQDGSSSTNVAANGSGSPSIRLDGVASAFATRDALHASAADGQWHIATFVGADLSSWADIVLGFYGASDAFNTDYDVVGLVVAPNTSENIELAEAALAKAMEPVGYSLST